MGKTHLAAHFRKRNNKTDERKPFRMIYTVDIWPYDTGLLPDCTFYELHLATLISSISAGAASSGGVGGITLFGHFLRAETKVLCRVFVSNSHERKVSYLARFFVFQLIEF